MTLTKSDAEIRAGGMEYRDGQLVDCNEPEWLAERIADNATDDALQVTRPKLLPAFATPPEVDRVYHVDCMTLLRALPDCSIDSIVTDPPYGLGLDTWDKPIDVPPFIDQCWRVLKPSSFLVFTNQMPYMMDWLIPLWASDFKFKDHISWVKRKHTNAATELVRAHESVFIFTKGSAKYVETKGKYEDIKLPGLIFGLITIEALDRHIKDLRYQLKSGKRDTTAKSNNKNAHTSHRFMPAMGVRAPEYANFTNVWSFTPHNMATLGNRIEHGSVKPELLFERCISLTTQPGDIVLDPFMGSGTTALAARNTGRHFIGCDTDAGYVKIARERLAMPYTPMLPLFEDAS